MANVSYRLGKQARPEVIREKIQASRELSDAFERCREYLRENEVNLDTTPAVLGPWVTFDPKKERFVNDFADRPTFAAGIPPPKQCEDRVTFVAVSGLRLDRPGTRAGCAGLGRVLVIQISIAVHPEKRRL
jgi:hypothetical protein